MKTILNKAALIAVITVSCPVFAAEPAQDDRHAREHETIRQLNRQELAKVQERDALELRRRHSDDQAMADYARRRAQYEHDLAQWRRAVAPCGNAYGEPCGH